MLDEVAYTTYSEIQTVGFFWATPFSVKLLTSFVRRRPDCPHDSVLQLDCGLRGPWGQWHYGLLGQSVTLNDHDRVKAQEWLLRACPPDAYVLVTCNVTSSTVRKHEQILSWKEEFFCLTCFRKPHPSPAVMLPTRLCCGEWVHFVNFCPILCGFGRVCGSLLRYTVLSFLFLAVDLDHCHTVIWQHAAYVSFHLETNCRLTLLFGRFLFTVCFVPFSFLVCCHDPA